MERDASATTRDQRGREWAEQILQCFPEDPGPEGDPEEGPNRLFVEYKKWISRHGGSQQERLHSIERVVGDSLSPRDKLLQMFATIAGDGESEFLATMLPRLLQRWQEEAGLDE